MKKITLTLIFTFVSTFFLFSQVTKVNYLLDYNCATNLYEVKLKILEGAATSLMERSQFNAQVSFVIPTGAHFEIVDNFNPIVGNQNYTGTVPTQWELKMTAISPYQNPVKDYHSIFVKLIPHSLYDNIEAGEEILLFSCKIGNTEEYNSEFRLFNSEIDPNVDFDFQIMTYDNFFRLGSPNNILDGVEYQSCTSNTKDESPAKLIAYPNPFVNSLNIQLSQSAEALQVSNLSGEVFHSSFDDEIKKLSLNTSEWSSGLYFIQVRFGDYNSVKKVVKH